MRGADVQGVVPAVFRSRTQAEAVIEDLRRLGLTDEQLGIAIPDAIRERLAGDIIGDEELRGSAAGFFIGAPIGSLAGIALFALAVGGLGPLGLGGILAGATAGAVWGMVLGTEAGLIAKVRSEEDQEHWSDIPLSREDILLVVRSGERTREVQDAVLRHGGQCFCFLDQPASAAS